MTSPPPRYHGYRFPPEIISHAVWLDHRFCLSFRDAEDLLAQRGITVTYETIRQWCQAFGLDYARRRRRGRGRMGHRCLDRRDLANLHQPVGSRLRSGEAVFPLMASSMELKKDRSFDTLVRVVMSTIRDEFASVIHHLRPPRYPYEIDQALAARGR